MSEQATIEQTTTKTSMSEIRSDLDAALGREFPGGMLQRRWDEDVLHLSGPGAQGTIVLRDGKLVGEATLKPPASLMKTMITEKIGKALAEAAG